MVGKENKDYNYAFMVGGATVLGALLLLFLIIKPLYSSNSSLRTEKAKRDAEATRLFEREKVLVSLKDKASEIKADSERVSSALPEGSDIGRLFIQLDELAKVSGGDLKSVSESVSIKTLSENSNISESNFSLPIDMPSYFALKKFFESSEDALRILNISNIRIDASEAGSLSVNMSANAYTRLK